MDSESSHEVAHPERLKSLACNVKFPGGNALLHQFVLDNSQPNRSGSENYINGVLLSMSDVPADVVNDDGFSAIQLAVLKDNLLLVRKLLSCLVNIDVNARYRREGYHPDDGNTALHLAAHLGHSSVVQELLRKGARIDIKNEADETALCYAARSGHLGVIKLLVSEGADVNMRCRGCTPPKSPLCHAVHSGNLEAVEFLVNNGADDIRVKRGWQALLQAAESGHLDIIKFLLDRGMNVDIKSKKGCYLLFAAVSSGNLAAVEFLVSNGADVNDKSRSHGTSLHAAVSSGSLEIVQFLVNNGADVNAKSRMGNTPLHEAANNTSLEIVEFLVDNGAEINARNRNDHTPLHRSAYSQRLEIAEFLVDRGADLEASDHELGITPLHAAVYGGSLDVIKFFVGKGADLHAKSRCGRTPLHFAVSPNPSCRIPHLEIAAFLLDHGADFHADVYGWTPLHTVANGGHAGLVRALLDRGADANAKNEDGKTALDLATKWNHQSCVDALQNVGQ